MKRIMAGIFSFVLAFSLAPAVAFAAEGAQGSSSTQQALTTSTKANDRTASAGYHLQDKAVYCISTALLAKNKMVLDVSGGSKANGANVQIYQLNTTLSQYWRAEYKGNGKYRFVSLINGRYLGSAANPKSGANVTMRSNGNIEWCIAKNSDGTFSLIPASATNMRLDVSGAGKRNGTNVQVYTHNGTKAQKFYFTKMAGLTEAYAMGKKVNAGIFEIAVQSNQKLRVDIANKSSAQGANVLLANDHAAASQNFQFTYVGNGLYTIRNAGSNRVLDVSAGSSKLGANIQQWAANGSLAQFWYMKPTGKGYQIKSAVAAQSLGTKGARAAAGANVQTAKDANTASQVYVLKSTRLVADGTYVITSSLASPMVLDISGASKADGGNVQIFRSNGTAAQKFRITHVKDGKYRIVNVNSGKAVAVARNSKDNNVNVVQTAPSSAATQLWTIEKGPYGIMFKSAATGKYLDVNGARVKRGTNVQQFAGNKSKAQCWVLENSNWQFYPTSTNIRDLSIMLKAEEYEGWPYKWGGRSPSTSFDCAGLVMYCSNQVWGTDFDLIYTNAERLYGMCQKISASQAKVGDLVFYRGTYNNIDYISHVVFYAGRGTIYGAGDPIGYQPINTIKNIKGEPAKYMFARIRH